MKNNSGEKKIHILLKNTAGFVFWICVWLLVARIADKELIVPYPLTVLKRLIFLSTKSFFWQITFTSLLRILAGFVAGCIMGSVFGAVSAFYPFFEMIIKPFIRMIRSTPVTSFIILVMLWIGYSFVPVFIAGLLVMPIMYMNIYDGIKGTDKGLLEVAQLYSFGKGKTFKTIYIPSIRRCFISGAVTSLGLAWKAGIAAEVICRPTKAIGTKIYFSKADLETPDLFAWTIVVILFSFLFEKIVENVAKKVLKEKEAEND